MKAKTRLTTFQTYKKRALKDAAFRKAIEKSDDDPFLEVAYRLITLRKEKGWTQAELAKRIGLPQQAVARLESLNYKGHTLQSLLKIAKASGKKLKISFVPA